MALVPTPQPLRYCLDAGFGQSVTELIRAAGVDVTHASEVRGLLSKEEVGGPSAAPDELLAAWCVRSGSILVVIDSDLSGRSPRAAAFREAGVEVILFTADLLGLEAQRDAVVSHHPRWIVALGAVDRGPRVWVQRKGRRPFVLEGRRRRLSRRSEDVRVGASKVPGRRSARGHKPRRRIVGDQPIYRYSFEWLPGATVLGARSEVLDAGAELYSAHYGRWGPGGNRPGEWIRMSPERLADELQDDDTCMALAWRDSQLVGYCVAVRFELPGRGRVVWVSQLVVHRDHRNYGVGTKLLYSVWQFSDCYAWGLATANPRAVRALETATRRRVQADLVQAHAPGLLPALQSHVGYLPDALVLDRGRLVPRVNTDFHIDLSEMTRLRSRSRVRGHPWELGDLPPGQEWFACTFGSQPPARMPPERLDELLYGTDQIWIDAYERMTLDTSHSWRAHAQGEALHVTQVAGVRPGARVLDVGCGDGRHTEALRDLGYVVVGADISSSLIARASERLGDSVELRIADARKDPLGDGYDLVVCLYDVIGSSGSADDDEVLLRNLYRSLAPGGTLVVSTMNAHVTLDHLSAENRPDDTDDFIARLESLTPSKTMETDGQIFDVSRILLFRDVHYRKEQFDVATERLPVEAVVRDRRYTPETLAALFEQAGMRGVTIRPVRLGHWSADEDIDAHDDRAKELLAVWRSPA